MNDEPKTYLGCLNADYDEACAARHEGQQSSDLRARLERAIKDEGLNTFELEGMKANLMLALTLGASIGYGVAVKEFAGKVAALDAQYREGTK